jgi:hypothetical protein
MTNHRFPAAFSSAPDSSTSAHRHLDRPFSTFPLVLRFLTPLAAAIAVLAPAAQARALRLAPDRLGPMHIGMTSDEASDALGAPVTAEPGVNGCVSFSYPHQRHQIQLLATRGPRLNYIAVYARGVATTRGVQIGDSLHRLQHKYRSRLHSSREGNWLGGPAKFYAVSKHVAGRTDIIRFAVRDGKVSYMEAGPRALVIGFGECA